MADGPAPQPTPRTRRTSPLLTASLVAAGALGAIALASRRSGIFGALADGTAPFGQVAARAGIGVLGGVLVATAVVALLRATNARHRLISDSPSRPSWRQVAVWSIPIVLLMAVLGAAAGSATTPLQPRQPDARPSGGGDDRICGRARYVDLDHDGRPDVNPDGTPAVVIDSDCDGTYDTRLQPCPNANTSGSTTFNGLARAVHAPAIQIPVDGGCDGDVDQWITIDERPLTRFEPTDQGTGNDGTRSTPRMPNFPDALRSLAWIIAIIAIVGGLYALYAFLTRRRGSGTTEPDPAQASGPEADDVMWVDRAAAVATLDDTIEAMLADPDPRTAVRAAYARLLDGLAAAGLPRAPYEAPDEHLTRCLRALDVRAEPLRELVDVFVLARFSEHPVTEDHRASALAALRDAQADLAGTLAGATASGE